MLAVLLTALFTFLVSSLFGYVVHWSLHQKWMGFVNQKHMTHHLSLYPPTNYTSEVYRNAGKDNTVIIFGIAAIPLVALPIILWATHILPLSLTITSLFVMVVMSFLHSYLHDAFHIKNHWLYRMPLINKAFSRWVHLHWLHHVRMDTNFGIFLFFLDKLLGSFWDDFTTSEL